MPPSPPAWARIALDQPPGAGIDARLGVGRRALRTASSAGASVSSGGA